MSHVLFVCTGNIFRSMTAEYALRDQLSGRGDIVVSSAGTEDFPHVVTPLVRDYLLTRGLDVRSHHRRTLTEELLKGAEHVIAMSTEHRTFLKERFNYLDAPLFTEACGLPSEPLPDIEEAVTDYMKKPDAVASHVRKIIDRIIELTPHLAQRLFM